MARLYSNAFDAHTHLDFGAFDGDRDDVVARARDAGVQGWCVAGADPEDWDRVARVAADTGGVAALGVHPWWAAELDDAALARHLDDLGRRTELCAIGETGLDHVRARTPAARARQLAALEAHVALARRRDLPLVLHCVRALPVVLGAVGADARGMVHGWTGSADEARRAVACGLHVSFGARISGSERIRQAARAVPGDRLLLETDAPDQPWTGHRRGEPAHLVHVAEAVADARGEPADLVLQRASERARLLFGA